MPAGTYAKCCRQGRRLADQASDGSGSLREPQNGSHAQCYLSMDSDSSSSASLFRLLASSPSGRLRSAAGTVTFATPGPAAVGTAAIISGRSNSSSVGSSSSRRSIIIIEVAVMIVVVVTVVVMVVAVGGVEVGVGVGVEAVVVGGVVAVVVVGGGALSCRQHLL